MRTRSLLDGLLYFQEMDEAPKFIGVILDDGTVIRINLTGGQWYHKLRNLPHGRVIGVAFLSQSLGTWSGQFQVRTSGGYKFGALASSYFDLDSAVTAVRQCYTQASEK